MATTRINVAVTLLVAHPDGAKVQIGEVKDRLLGLLDEANLEGSDGQPDDFYLTSPRITIGPSIVKE